MNYLTSSRRGILIAIHQRAWLAVTLAVSLALQPLVPMIAEAAISSSGEVFASTNLTIGNTLAGTRTVDGIGVVDGPFQFITVGQEAGADGSYVITNGGSASSTAFTTIGQRGTGHLTISAGGVFSTTTLASGGLTVGGEPGGNGTLSVTGVGSMLSVARNPVVGSAGSGTATFGGGAHVTAPRLLVGISATIGGVPFSGSGTVNIEDAGTLVTLGGQSSNFAGGVFFNSILVGYGGTGHLNVTGGAKLDLAPNIAGHRAGIQVGGPLGLPGDGTMTVSGPGSEARVRGDATLGSTLTGFVQIGRGDPSGAIATPGTLNVLNGGNFVVEDTPASTAVAPMYIGVMAGGTGTLLVSGAGSHVGVAGSFTVGQKLSTDPVAAGHGSGDVTVTDGGSLGAVRLRVGDGTVRASAGGQLGSSTGLVGDATGQVGSLTVTGPTSAWTIAGPIPPGDSRNIFTVGRLGTGTLDIIGGGQLVVDSGPNLGPAGVIGRFAGSVGTINVSGVGSLIEIKGLSDKTVADPLAPGRSMGSGFNVGDQGQGTLNVTAGGKVVMSATNVVTGLPENAVSIGRSVGGSGTALVSGAGSEISALDIRVALDPADLPAGTGVLTIAAGGKVTVTGNLKIGPAGTLNGSGGTIVGNVVNLGGTVNPGQSAGRLSIIGDYESVGGKLVVEVDVNGNHDVLTVVGTATFDPASVIEIKIDPGFLPTTGTSLDVVQVKATLEDPAQSLLTVQVPSGGGGATTQGALSSLPTTVSVVSVPAAPLALALDIQPGMVPNVLNAQSLGPLPVAILGSPAFAVSEIDPASITLSAPGVGLSATGDPALCAVMDVNGDQIADLLCYLARGDGETPGDATATLNAVTATGIPAQGSDSITLVNHALVLSGLGPAMVWIGLKNSDAVGLRLDVLAEVYLGTTMVGTGQVNNVPSGSSGFNNAVLHTIPLSLVSGLVPFAGGTELKLTVSSRRTCFGSGHNSGTPRLWYNGRPVDSGNQRDAGTGFTATVDGDDAEYFLRAGLLLSPLAGSARQFTDRMVNSNQGCPNRAFTPFGTWAVTP